MGVYHLMGLGTSPGAVTAPLSYLAHRYRRWNSEDATFFERSGEAKHRTENKKVGDVQALVFLTTEEVLSGKLQARGYIKNIAGSTKGASGEAQPMKQVLSGLLAEILPDFTERKTVDIFWCEIDRRDIQDVYAKVVQVVSALSGVGKQGKEMWANLTGGNNVTNLSLQLAANLSGQIARLYYVQAQDESAEKCVFYTAEKNYWVELPAMPLSLSPVMRAILDVLSHSPNSSDSELYSRLLQHEQYWSYVQGIAPANFYKAYLEPMWKQGLIRGEKKYVVGDQWDLIRPYETLWQEIKEQQLTIEQLAQQENWLEYQELSLR